ncbi:trafficking protein particle complex subunit 6b-like [Halichondria panicea]|uniref:trafficking protein particle complex subunit 6b-like n=1 Tax=Halichondria panicea TaxID=6063 RepID=UPI00312BAE5B
MSTVTINPDVSQCVFEFLHAEVVDYFLEQQSSDKCSQPEVIEKLERLGHRVGESLVERTSRDSPRFRTELDAVVFICKHFWSLAFNKPIDNLKTNHQDTYVLHDYNFRLLTHMSHSEQYKDKAPLYLAFSCGLVSGALTNLGIRCQVSAEALQMPACIFQVKVLS